MSNNFETVRDTRNMSKNHDYKTGVAHSDCVNQNCVKHRTAEKSQWRQIRLAIKPRYLGNHASQINGYVHYYYPYSYMKYTKRTDNTHRWNSATNTQESYFGTLSGSQGCSFRIRHDKVRAAPLVEDWQWRHIRLAIKPHYLGYLENHKKSQWITVRKSRSLFQNPPWTTKCSAHWQRTDSDVICGCQYNLITSETMLRRWKVTLERYSEIMVALSESVMKNCVKRPLAEKSPWPHIRLAIKPHYLGNHASQIKTYFGTLPGNHGRFFKIRHNIVRVAFQAEALRWRHIRLTITPRYLGNRASQIKSYYGTQDVMVALSDYIAKNRLKRPLAAKSRWRHIRLVLKPRYLENHVSHEVLIGE